MFGLIPFRMTRGNNTTISSLTDLFDNFFNDDFTAAFNGSNDLIVDTDVCLCSNLCFKRGIFT